MRTCSGCPPWPASSSASRSARRIGTRRLPGHGPGVVPQGLHRPRLQPRARHGDRGARREETPAASALGVVGDSAGPTGLYATPDRRHRPARVPRPRDRAARAPPLGVQGLVLGVVMFLAIGLIFCPYADAHLDTPMGSSASTPGGWTPSCSSGSVAGAFGLVGARCYDLSQRASWWRAEERPPSTRQLAELTGRRRVTRTPRTGARRGPRCAPEAAGPSRSGGTAGSSSS